MERLWTICPTSARQSKPTSNLIYFPSHVTSHTEIHENFDLIMDYYISSLFILPTQFFLDVCTFIVDTFHVQEYTSSDTKFSWQLWNLHMCSCPSSVTIVLFLVLRAVKLIGLFNSWELFVAKSIYSFSTQLYYFLHK